MTRKDFIFILILIGWLGICYIEFLITSDFYGYSHIIMIITMVGFILFKQFTKFGKWLEYPINLEKKIIKISDKRLKIYNEYQDSYSDEKEDYTINYPDIIDVYENDILDIIKKNHNKLKVEFIIEELTKLGQAPNILYDDNGHFAITSEGWQSLSSNYDKEDDRDDIQLGFEIKKDKWFNTIREALTNYLSDE